MAWFVRRRAQFRAVLQSSQSGLTTAHYVRLIALSVTEMVYMTFMCGFILFVNVQEYGMRPWVSWDFVHAEWYDVPQFAKVLVPQYFWNNFIAVWYIIPLTSVIFFTFFGFGREANAEYRKWFQWIQTRVFRMKPKVDPMLPTL
jgi:pheromone a factor receptor